MSCKVQVRTDVGSAAGCKIPAFAIETIPNTATAVATHDLHCLKIPAASLLKHISGCSDPSATTGTFRNVILPLFDVQLCRKYVESARCLLNGFAPIWRRLVVSLVGHSAAVKVALWRRRDESHMFRLDSPRLDVTNRSIGYSDRRPPRRTDCRRR
jgi:hypothetical protein